MTRVETEEYFDKNCWSFLGILLIIFYIICSYQIALLIWFADKNVEIERGVVGFLNKTSAEVMVIHFE